MPHTVTSGAATGTVVSGAPGVPPIAGGAPLATLGMVDQPTLKELS